MSAIVRPLSRRKFFIGVPVWRHAPGCRRSWSKFGGDLFDLRAWSFSFYFHCAFIPVPEPIAGVVVGQDAEWSSQRSVRGRNFRWRARALSSIWIDGFTDSFRLL